MTTIDPNLEELKERLSHNPITGIFVWIDCRKPYLNGSEAGTKNTAGYKVLRYKGKMYYCHKLAWYFVNGIYDEEIDHKDLVKCNNAIDNLRSSTHQQNLCNQGLRTNNKSGVKGVYWNKRKNKWHSQITVHGVSIHLGYFDDLTAATEAYNEASRRYHKDFGKTNDYYYF